MENMTKYKQLKWTKILRDQSMSEMVVQKEMQVKKINKLMMAWIVWGLAATFYFSDYLARVAPSVMHRVLQADFGINEAGFGLLTASFYIPYVLMQIPVGLIVDRLSIRTVLTVMSVITAIGCVVFGISSGLLTASIGRMLIGFSAAFAFVSSLRLATSWFPPAMLGLLAGLTQALGMLGAAAGVAPVAFLVGSVGWRNSMLVMAVLFVVLAVFLFQFIKDSPEHHAEPKIKKNNYLGLLESLKVVLTHKQTWLNALYAGFLFTPTAVIGEAWGPAYLQFGRGFSAHESAFAIGLIFIGWGIGGPITGWLSDRIGKRKPIMYASSLIGLGLIYLLIFGKSLEVNTAYWLCFLFGLTNTGVAIAYAVSTEIQTQNVMGTTIGFTNMASIFVGASLQPLIGKLIDYIAGSRSYHVEQLTLNDFQYSLKLLPACLIVCIILSLFIKETNCSPVRGHE
jgi:sugar phosphate permease